MQLVVGVVLFVLGFLIVRGCIRDYRDDLGGALADDLWDYLRGRTFAILAAAFLTLIGAIMIYTAFFPGSLISF